MSTHFNFEVNRELVEVGEGIVHHIRATLTPRLRAADEANRARKLALTRLRSLAEAVTKLEKRLRELEAVGSDVHRAALRGDK